MYRTRQKKDPNDFQKFQLIYYLLFQQPIKSNVVDVAVFDPFCGAVLHIYSCAV